MTERLRIPVPAADMTVSARLDGDPSCSPLLVFGHGAGAGIDHPLQQLIVRSFVAAGIAVLRYQFPFMERKGGVGFGRDPLPLAVTTVRAAFGHGRDLAGSDGLLAGGHSYGGRISSHAALDGGLEGARGLVLLSFPLQPRRRSARGDRSGHLGAVGLPMLFVSGDRDPMAPTPALEDKVAALERAECVRIPGADHGWRAPQRLHPDGPTDAVAAAVAAWIERLQPA